VSFSASLNPASAGLLGSVADGNTVDDWVVENRDSNGLVLERWDLEDTFVNSFQAGGGGDLPVESFSLSVAKVTYTQFAPGKGGTSTKSTWDQVQQKGSGPADFGKQVYNGVDQVIDFDGLGQAEIFAFSWGAHAAQGAGGGQAVAGEFVVTMPSSIASPSLLRAAAEGDSLSQVTLINRRSSVEFSRYVLKDVLITSFSHGSTPGAGAFETFTLNFTELTYTVTPTKTVSHTVSHNFAAPGPQGAGGGAFPFKTITPTQLQTAPYASFKGPSSGLEGEGYTIFDTLTFGATGQIATGAGSQLSEVSLSLPLSEASAVWIDALAQQGKWSDVTLTVPVSTAGNPVIQYTYHLSNVRLTSYSTGFSSGSGAAAEQISLRYDKIDVDYLPVNEKGVPGKLVHLDWNLLSHDGKGPTTFGDRTLPSVGNKIDFMSGQTPYDTVLTGVERNPDGTLVAPYFQVIGPGFDAMPGLLFHTLTGDEIPSVTIYGPADPNTGEPVTRWDLENVHVGSFSQSLVTGGQAEGYLLYYQKVTYTTETLDNNSKPVKFTSSWEAPVPQGTTPPNFAGQKVGTSTTDTATVSITVKGVNDAPAFTLSGDVRVKKSAPAQTLTGWATGISAGPGEAGQTLNFIVAADDPSLFQVQPAISANGTLTFTPAAGKVGATAVKVFLQDNGGTQDGGVDKSLEQTFRIIILPPPTVTQANFANFTAPMKLVFKFSGDVGGSLDVNDLVLTSAAGEVSLANANLAYDAAARTAVWTLGALLADGNHRATLRSGGILDVVGNPLDGDANGTAGDDFAFNFTQLAADANHDGAVDNQDFLILRASFGQSGKDQSNGDVDYNGVVNFADYQKLGLSFGKTAASFPPAKVPVFSEAVTAPIAPTRSDPARSSVAFGKSRIEPPHKRRDPRLPRASDGLKSP
jgi:type VI protein secretion system component Hcp